MAESTVLPPSPNYTYPARLERVHDANTVILWVDLGLNVHTRLTLQLVEIAPIDNEMADAAAAGWLRDWFAAMVEQDPAVHEFPFVARVFKAIGGGRWEGEVWYPFGSASLNTVYLMTDLVQRPA